MNTLKVIFHIDDKERWNRVLGNVKNLLNEVNSEEIQIVVLANGNSVKKYKENSEDTRLIQDLYEKNVKFSACNNSLNNLNLKKEELLEFVNIVSAGVLELIEKQNQGYAYIKP